ncbi:hypothetical protein AAMO2058_000646200 [Amorphochlora amoebiformis]
MLRRMFSPCEEARSSNSRVPAPAHKRAKVANYVVQSCYNVDTKDYEDHTFSGIMFDLHCKDHLPIEFIEIRQVWVRGYLGPMTVWVTPESHTGKQSYKREWKMVHRANHEESMNTLKSLKLDKPLRLKGGQQIGMYVHSGLEGDMGIVYNNKRRRVTHDDPHMRILPGMAHISDEPFSNHGYWGGGAWRWNREFVGRVTYGVKWMLWNPDNRVHKKFPSKFREMILTILMCHRRKGSPLRKIPCVVLYYLFNMLPWDWAENCVSVMSGGSSGKGSGSRGSGSGSGSGSGGSGSSFDGQMGEEGGKLAEDSEDEDWEPEADDMDDFKHYY